MSNGCACGCEEKQAKLLAVIEKNKNVEGSLIHVLHEAQEIYGYLPISVQKIVAEGLNIPLAEVYGVVTFYTQFSLKPKGEYKISVCLGTACYVKGSNLVLDEILKDLKLSLIHI